MPDYPAGFVVRMRVCRNLRRLPAAAACQRVVDVCLCPEIANREEVRALDSATVPRGRAQPPHCALNRRLAPQSGHSAVLSAISGLEQRAQQPACYASVFVSRFARTFARASRSALRWADRHERRPIADKREDAIRNESRTTAQATLSKELH